MEPNNVQRRVTTAEQANARNYLSRAIRSAAFQRTAIVITSPFAHVRIAIMVATAVIVVASIIALLLAWLKPSPNTGIDKVMMGQEGGLWALTTSAADGVERLHPVLNTASARLISGTSERPKIVKDEVLGKYPIGMPMGIPYAPNSLIYRSEAQSAWQVCDWHDGRTNLSLTKADSLRTTVIAGTDVRKGGASLGGDKAVVVRVADNPQPWLLFRNTRTKIGREDYTMHAALGVATDKVASPMVVSDGLLNAIPPVPDLKLPELRKLGQSSTAVPGFAVGDVLAYRDIDGSDKYVVVEDSGAQDVPFIVAKMVITNGGTQKNVTDQSMVSHFKRTAEITLANYPDTIPRIIAPDTICYSWNKQPDSNRADIDIITDTAIPVTDSARKNTVDLLRSESEDTASRFISTPGKGWFIRITGDGEYSEAREQIAYVDSSGIFYALIPDDKGNYTPTAAALGLSGSPNLIPESIANLLLPGPDLSFAGAKVESVQGKYVMNPLIGGNKGPSDFGQVGGQDIPVPPEQLPTITATQTQTQTATATVSAPPAPGGGSAGAPPPSGANPPAASGGARPTGAAPPPRGGTPNAATTTAARPR